MNKKTRFYKGQLVAVRTGYCNEFFDDDKWRLAVYIRKAKNMYSVLLPPQEYLDYKAESYWRECVPAQEIWPWLKDLNPRVIDDAT